MIFDFENAVNNLRSRRPQQRPNYVELPPTDYLMNILDNTQQQQPMVRQPQPIDQAQALLDYKNVYDNRRQMATISMLRTQLEKGIKPDDLYNAIPESNRYLLDTILSGGTDSKGRVRQNLAEEGPGQGTWGQRK